MEVNERVAAVVGNGIIGHGIAEIFAAHGWQVRLIGRSGPSLEKSLAKIRKSLQEFVDERLLEPAEVDASIGRITTTVDLAAAADAEFVVEALPEDMDLKLKTFSDLDSICVESTILASSSGHPASELDLGVKRKHRVIAAHFWFPPQLIPVVEVCGSPNTSADTVSQTMDVLRSVGKEPVAMEREIAGFLGNRIQFAALREAWSLWASGVASAEAIDAVVSKSFGRRLAITGPIASADLGGLDTIFRFATFVQPDLDAAPHPPGEVEKLVSEGHNGLATGRGLYDWSRHDGEALLNKRRRELFRWLRADKEEAS